MGDRTGCKEVPKPSEHRNVCVFISQVICNVAVLTGTCKWYTEYPKPQIRHQDGSSRITRETSVVLLGARHQREATVALVTYLLYVNSTSIGSKL